MAQPSVISYFNTRKRSAVEDSKLAAARKVLILDKNCNNSNLDNASQHCRNVEILQLTENTVLNAKVVQPKQTMARKVIARQPKPRRIKELTPQRDIEQFLQNMAKTVEKPKQESKDQTKTISESNQATSNVNLMDKIQLTGKEPTLKEIKQKLTRSAKLAELKASIARFKEHEAKLEKIEQKTAKIPDSPSLKTFKKLELEVQLSPQKTQSPEKGYLSPKKNTAVRRNLLNSLSPTKNAVELNFSPSKLAYQSGAKSLTLPYKYRTIAEIFRSIDTVCQIIYNRKETITFRKIKPAVEEMLKKNIYEKHLAQIKSLFPDAFELQQEKIKVFGTGTRQEQWELVVAPNIAGDSMTAEVLLERRRKMFFILIEKTKDYHEEFLTTLDPPLVIPREKLARWHPEFDIEKVPDINQAELPKPPKEETYTSGKDVLEKARSLFNCNTRMEAALERLKTAKETVNVEEQPKATEALLKGIPKALLEKVRQRQAAKVFESLTRSDAKEKEIQEYSRLPELARLTRNLFVAEKKSVLPLDTVVQKLEHSFRAHLTKEETERYLRKISEETPGWLVFHEIRNSVFVKVSKNADLNLVLSKLEAVLKEKTKT